MPNSYARYYTIHISSCRALLVSLPLLISGCNACVQQKPKEEKYLEGQSLLGERLFDFVPKNCDKELGTTPLLFMQFLGAEQKKSSLTMKELLQKSSASSLCPPGPFMVDGNSALDVHEKKWLLPNTPDFFLWYSQDDIALFDFYLTNQSGFPIKSQAVKLNQEKDSLLVLLPKTSLEVGKTYYLYLVEKNETSKKTWVQPLSIAKKD